MQHPHIHEIAPKSAAEAFLSSCESMSIWQGLGFSLVAESHRRAAERFVAEVPSTDSVLLAQDVIGSRFLKSQSERMLMLQMLEFRPTDFAPFFRHVLHDSEDPLLQFRAARKILSLQSRGEEGPETTSRTAEKAPSPSVHSLERHAKQVVNELGDNFESLHGVYEKLAEFALSGSFDQNPCIGYLRDQLNLCSGRRGRDYILRQLEGSLASPDPSLRLASVVVLSDCMQELRIGERVARKFSERVETEANSDVRYYMTEALSSLVRQTHQFQDVSLRTQVLDCLLSLKRDNDGGVRLMANMALRG